MKFELTKEQWHIYYANRRRAREYFGISEDKNLVLHHKNPDWRQNDVVRYIQWNPEDLEIMTLSEHSKLHNSGKKSPMYGKHLSDETKQKKREAMIGEKNPQWGKRGEKSPNYGKHHSEETKQKIGDANRGEKNYLYGKHHSEETKKKMSEANKGKHRSEEAKQNISEAKIGVKNPSYGKHWYTNGITNIFTYDCPEGFQLGRKRKGG